MRVFFSDPFGFPLPAGHRFPLAKYRMLRERIERWPAALGVELLVAPRVQRAELLAVHDPAYVEAFLVSALDAAHQRRIGFPWSPEFVERTLRSCGGTVAAARAALSDGGAVHLAGGTHHARADRGAGYCVFHDVAVAARLVQREHGVGQVLVVDTDVHQGDGTAAIFAEDPSVFTFSLHGAANFPGDKAVSDLDCELPRQCGDAAYLQALDHGLAAAFRRCRPDCVFYISGADPARGDRLGTLQIGKAALAERDRRVFAACVARRLPVITVMGGGYGRNLDDTVDVHEETVRAALVSAWAQ